MVKMKIGRPRSEKSQEAILDATSQLLAEKGGAGLTLEAISRRAKVGKPTLYRWWPSLADIVLEVVLRQADKSITVPPFDTLRDTLRQFLRHSMKAITDGGGVDLRFLMAHAQKDDDFRERFKANFVSKRRATLQSIFLHAVDCGQIDSEQNLEILLDLVFGAMWYRLLVGHAPMDESFADELTEMVVRIVKLEGNSPPLIGFEKNV